jgi:signal transduction histidine kinase
MRLAASRLSLVVGFGLPALGTFAPGLPGVPGGTTVSAQRLPLRTYSSADGLAGDHINALLIDSRGLLWVGTTTGLSRFDGHEFRHYGVADGLPHPSVVALLEDRDRVLWVGTRSGLVRIEPNGTRMEPVPLSHAGDRDSTRPGGSVQASAEAPNIRLLLQTRDGRVWVAVHQRLLIFANERQREAAERITVSPPLPPPSPSSASQDREWDIEAIAEGTQGDVWIGTRWGLMRRLRDGRMQHFPIRPAPRDDRVYHIAADRDGCVLLGAGWLAYRSRMNRLLALARVRARIATDLHDDLGARLSRISILSEVASRRVSTDAASAAHLIHEVGATARSLIETAADLTWAVDPRQDDLGSLAARVRRFAADMLDAREIGWTFDAPDDSASASAVIRLPAEHRRHVLLVFQEAINNIVRHAEARRVSLGLSVNGRRLQVKIEDDGRGFEADDARLAGRGLTNIATRARELGGELTITSAPAGGTRVWLAVPLH